MLSFEVLVERPDPIARIAAVLCASRRGRVLKEKRRIAQGLLKAAVTRRRLHAPMPLRRSCGRRSRPYTQATFALSGRRLVAEQVQTTQFRIGDWLVSPTLDQIEREGETIKLEPRTMRLLLRLSQAPGEVVSGQQLLDDVWAGVVVSSQSVYQAISQLRKLLGDVDEAPTYIATIPRKGYRLVAPVRSASRLSAEPLTAPQDNAAAIAAPAPPVAADRGADRMRKRVWSFAAAAALIAALSYVWIERTSTVDTRKTSVVVLPFVDMTEGQKDVAFTDGLTEEISTSLAQLPTLRVIARTSAYAVRDQKLDAEQIGRKLSATHIIEGTVRRSGDIVRVTAQLVDARRGHRSWSEVYDLPANNLLRLQGDIARAVAQTLDIRFSEQDSRRLNARSPKSAEAYELYLLSRRYFRQRTPEANARSIELNVRALALDPGFALAQVGLAQARFNEYALGSKTLAAAAAEVEPLIDSALEINDELAEAFATRGAVHREFGRLREAELDLRRAVDLDPSNITATANMGRVLQQQGRVHEALHHFIVARDLDPLDFMRFVQLCDVRAQLGAYRDADLDCAQARRLQPLSEWSWLVSMWLARAQGQTAESLILNQAALQAMPSSVELHLQRVDDLLVLGLYEEARMILSRARDIEPRNVATDIAGAMVALISEGAPSAGEQLRRISLSEDASAVDLLAAAQLAARVDDVKLAAEYAGRAAQIDDYARLEATRAVEIGLGYSHDLVLGEIDLRMGDIDAAEARARALLATLADLEAGGCRAWGLHLVRAAAFAMLDKEPEAVAALTAAVDLGWRESWSAEYEPFTRIRSSPALQALAQRVAELNRAERERYLARSSLHLKD